MGGAIIILSAVLYPYVYLTARASFVQQSVCVLEVARTLGQTSAGAFWRVALPLARPALAAGLALALMETLNDLGAVQYLGVQTLTRQHLHDLAAALEPRGRRAIGAGGAAVRAGPGGGRAGCARPRASIITPPGAIVRSRSRTSRAGAAMLPQVFARCPCWRASWRRSAFSSCRRRPTSRTRCRRASGAPCATASAVSVVAAVATVMLGLAPCLRAPGGTQCVRAFRRAGRGARLCAAGNRARARTADPAGRSRQCGRCLGAPLDWRSGRPAALGQPVRGRAGLCHPFPGGLPVRAGGRLRAPVPQSRCGGAHAG